jgi:hypothetical protein
MNTLFRDSNGHHSVHCEACHGEPHAVVPSTHAADNAQMIGLQGVAAPLSKCSVCHINTPGEGFDHRLSD